MDLERNAKKNKEFFDGKTDGYDNVHSKYMETKKELTTNLPSDARNILDLGAGTGLELIELFRMYPDAKVTALDISQKMLDKIKERDFADRVNIVCGDFFKTDFGSGYDAVISTSALHHFPKSDKVTLYKKVFDCLKDGGVFINSDKIVHTSDEEIEQLRLYEEFIDSEKYPHIDTPLTVEHEKESLEASGFTDISVSDTDQDDYRLFKAYKRN